MNLGDIITVITAIAIGFHLTYTSVALEKGADPVVITFQQLIITAIIRAILSIFTKGDYFSGSLINYLGILYLAIFASFYAYVIQNFALIRVKPDLASIIVSTEPFFL